MKRRSNLAIVCQPSLSKNESSKFYIMESLVGTYGDPIIEDTTLLGDVGIHGHIVGIENTFAMAKKIYKQLLIGAEFRAKHTENV